MATIKDVAALAGVSVSTVSYALNGTRTISGKKKAEILDAAAKLRYTPKAAARRLASGQAHILAILFPIIERGISFSELELITQAAKKAGALGYHLVIWMLQTNSEDELRNLLSQELVDGVILMEAHNRDYRLPIVNEFGIPYIMVGYDKAAHIECYVDSDIKDMMMRCVEYLKKYGHQNIAFISQSEKALAAGYCVAVIAHETFEYFTRNFGINGSEYFFSGDTRDISEKTAGILKSHPETTAFIVMNDNALAGIIAGAKKTGRSLPRDLSLVTILSSSRMSSFFLPELTSFEMDTEGLMDTAVSQLVAKIEGHYVELNARFIPTIFKERSSAGPV